jgi:thioredoxin family protein
MLSFFMNFLDFRALWDRALPYHQFVQEAANNRDLWTGMYRIARIPDWALSEARSTGTKHHLLVIAEDWCGDGTNTIPYLAKLADLSRVQEVRVLRRDEHPEVMDRYLTDGARAIPIVIVLDRHFEELGHWGPRPEALQAWVKVALKTADKARLYPRIRRWYATDKGGSTLREVLALMKHETSDVRHQPVASAVSA